MNPAHPDGENGYWLRPFRQGDARALAQVFRAAVRELAARTYTAQQTCAWLGRADTLESDLARRAETGSWIMVASDRQGQAVAYVLLEADGHLDHLYCHPDHARRGLALRLLHAAEAHARASGITRLFTEASEPARSVFERAGYRLEHRRDFTIAHQGREVAIHNYAMVKPLG